MNKKIYLMPLGGGQRVGASCYFLKLGDNNIILDAGIGKKEDLIFEPDMYSLKGSSLINSLNLVSHIFISHAHVDHIGYLLKLMREANHATVYMTELTALLTKYQLYDKNFILNTKHTEEEARLAAKFLLDKVVTVNYMQTICFNNYKVTFYPAGHIPGAMMMLFEYGRRKILYTGDYSIDGTRLTTGCYLPENIKIDTMIMCGLHAKHPDYRKKDNMLSQNVREVFKCVVENKRNVICRVNQLSKGIEVIKELDFYNQYGVPIYIDAGLIHLINKMEKLSIPIMSRNLHPWNEQYIDEPHIVVTTGGYQRYDYIHKSIDFSLHEDFFQMKNFIIKTNPDNIYMVHCAEPYNVFDDTIEQEIMREPDCKSQFIYAQEQEIYQI